MIMYGGRTFLKSAVNDEKGITPQSKLGYSKKRSKRQIKERASVDLLI